MPKREYHPKALEIIMDTYIPHSTKSGTREDRGETGTRIHITGLGQKMPDTENSWNSLLSNSVNKTDLIKLFVVYLKSDEVRNKFSVPVTVTAGPTFFLAKLCNIVADSFLIFREKSDSFSLLLH